MYCKPPFGGPAQVLKYLARYTHRVAIGNSRLVSLAEGRVTFGTRTTPTHSVEGDDARRRGVPASLGAARLAPRVREGPALRTAGESPPGGEADGVPSFAVGVGLWVAGVRRGPGRAAGSVSVVWGGVVGGRGAVRSVV